jgi:hypothetical protein
MPSKRQAKAWSELLVRIQQETIEAREREQQERLERTRQLTAEIARLQSKGPNAGREKQIRLLRRQLAKV